MQVETFECVETAAEPIEASEEAIGIIDDLELAGQQKLVHATDSGQTSRIPYRKIRTDEHFVYLTLCPKQTVLEEYDASPIPLRVLQIAAHAAKIDIFKKLWVWSAPEVVEKDPVLVAATSEYTYSGAAGEIYILARWAEELESFPVILKRAATKARDSLVQSAEKVLALVKSATDEELIEKGPNRRIDW